MAAKKLSEIVQGTPTSNDFVVGVTAGNQDRRFPVTALGKRAQLTGNTNYYVSSTGSDSNDGTSATQVPGTLTGPWATLQHADDTITGTIDINGWNIAINIAAGTYVGVETINSGYFSSAGTKNGGLGFVTCNVQYQGDDVTPSNVKISATSFRGVSFGQFTPNTGALVGVTLSGLDHLTTSDTAVWYDNFYVGNPSFGGAGVQNSQFDACCNGLPLMSGNVSVNGSILINGAGGGFAGKTVTAIQADGNESALGANFFQEATITITGTPTISNAIDQIQASSCLIAGGGKFVGAYTGNPFRVAEHSRLVSPFVGWNHANWGTPSGKPVITDGGLFVVVTASQGLEATGGQLIGVHKNYSQPATGFTLNIGMYDGLVIIDPAAGLATGTIVMPSPAIDQQRINIRTSQTITALTVSPGAGQAVVAAPTTLAAGGTIDAVYQDSNASWYF